MMECWRVIRAGIDLSQIASPVDEPEQWLHDLRERLEHLCRRAGIKNNTNIGTLIHDTYEHVREKQRIGDLDYLIELFISEVRAFRESAAAAREPGNRPWTLTGSCQNDFFTLVRSPLRALLDLPNGGDYMAFAFEVLGVTGYTPHTFSEDYWAQIDTERFPNPAAAATHVLAEARKMKGEDQMNTPTVEVTAIPTIPAPDPDKVSPAEALVSLVANVIIDGHRVQVTARYGATPEMIADHIATLMSGLRQGAARSKTSYGVIEADGRDRVNWLKGQPAAPAPAPTNPTPNGASGGAQVTSSDAPNPARCGMIEVGTSYQGGKLQLKFTVDGMEHALNFTKGKGDMIKLLSNARKSDGTPFTDADLEIGRRYFGAWNVRWSTSEKDGKKFRNVEAVTA